MYSALFGTQVINNCQLFIYNSVLTGQHALNLAILLVVVW